MVWETNQRCPTFGCCYLPGSPNALAVCGPANSVSIYDTSAECPAEAKQHSAADFLHESHAISGRHLLCVAASPDSSAIAASGTDMLFSHTAPHACVTRPMWLDGELLACRLATQLHLTC